MISRVDQTLPTACVSYADTIHLIIHFRAMIMSLTEQQKKRLRGLGHKLKPVITVGTGGLSDSLLEEFERSLEYHELMKIKVNTGDRSERDTAIGALCEYSGAQLIQRVGNVGLLFRKKNKNSKFAAL
jgi:RNA-binding protein